MSLTSALSITRSVNPPRAVFTDYPLGHTSGKPHDAASQRTIVSAALALLRDASEPGALVSTDLTWAADDDWKDSVMRPAPSASGSGDYRDDRTERVDIPQYQSSADAECADPDCPTCVWVA